MKLGYDLSVLYTVKIFTLIKWMFYLQPLNKQRIPLLNLNLVNKLITPMPLI